ncbi:unnamed protein product, partial [Coregonus sp. 'balchen']
WREEEEEEEEDGVSWVGSGQIWTICDLTGSDQKKERRQGEDYGDPPIERMAYVLRLCVFLDGPGEQEETEGGGGGRGPAAGGEVLSGEEELSEEEKIRRRAERRRAKRKRQKERKKLEKEEKSGDAEQEEGGAASESESESEEEKREGERVGTPAKTTPPLTVSGNKSNHQPPVRTPEEPEWDVCSAFVANAASHIRHKARTRAGHASRENKENEAGTSEVESSDPLKRKGASLTGSLGIVRTATGVWSFTPLHYQMLRSPSSSLLTGQRDTSARGDLGFEEGQSVLLLEKFTTVQAALGPPEAARVVDLSSPQDSTGSPCPSLWVGNVTVDLTEKHIWDLFKTCGEIESIRVLHERFCAFVNFKNANMAALALERLQGVELESTRLVIRYPDHWMQRTPPSPQRTNPRGLNTSSASQYASTGPRRMAPINGDECFFWRTTGCLYGDKCHFKHKPDQRGRDRKPWQP